MTDLDDAREPASRSPAGLLTRPLRPYAEIFEIPGAWRFSVAGIIGRMPMSMFGLGTVLLISAITGKYGVAGTVSAAGSLGYAFSSPRLGRLVDSHGQRSVLLPLLAAIYVARANYEQLWSETHKALDTFVEVIDERDPSTARHSERVTEYVHAFCAYLGLKDRQTAGLVEAARYHDLGKVVVDVATLSASRRLEAHEVASIRSHARMSARLLEAFAFAADTAPCFIPTKSFPRAVASIRTPPRTSFRSLSAA